MRKLKLLLVHKYFDISMSVEKILPCCVSLEVQKYKNYAFVISKAELSWQK